MSGTRIAVSGQDARGKSVIVSDELVAPVGAGISVTPLWAGDETPRFPLAGARTPVGTLFPGPGGYRFLIMTIPPDADVPAVETQSADDVAQIGSGGTDWMEEDEPGMHTTDTVDFEVVLSGEASQEFDDGAVIHLKAGDCFVQNGTRHRWFNRGTVPAVVAVVLVGGHPRR